MADARLTRDLDEAMLGGVLAGLSARYEWDVTLVRIVAVLPAVATGLVPLPVVYLAAWVIVPPASEVDEVEAPEGEEGSGEVAGTGPEGAVDEVTTAVQEAADRLGEAGKIAADAVRQAAEEIGEVVRRPRDGSAAATPGNADDDGEKEEGQTK